MGSTRYCESNFQKVLKFNKSFGVPINTDLQKDLFIKDPALVNFRLDLILEEVGELKEAIKNSDFEETIDALTDILYVVYGAYTAFGVDADKAFDIVQESNMSKLCKTEQEAKDTVEWYLKNEPRYDSPEYRKSSDDINYIVFNKSTRKILKSINYTPANFKNDSLIC